MQTLCGQNSSNNPWSCHLSPYRCHRNSRADTVDDTMPWKAVQRCCRRHRRENHWPSPGIQPGNSVDVWTGIDTICQNLELCCIWTNNMKIRIIIVVVYIIVYCRCLLLIVVRSCCYCCWCFCCCCWCCCCGCCCRCCCCCCFLLLFVVVHHHHHHRCRDVIVIIIIIIIVDKMLLWIWPCEYLSARVPSKVFYDHQPESGDGLPVASRSKPPFGGSFGSRQGPLHVVGRIYFRVHTIDHLNQFLRVFSKPEGDLKRPDEGLVSRCQIGIVQSRHRDRVQQNKPGRVLEGTSGYQVDILSCTPHTYNMVVWWNYESAVCRIN